MRKTSLVLLFIVFSSSSVLALDCEDRGTDQTGMNDCAYQSFQKSDATLNRKFKIIMGCLKGDDGSKQFLEAQRAWIKFRDAECKFQGSASEGGTAQPMVVGGCLRSETDTRIKEFDYYLSCEEGDMSCPIPNCRERSVPGAQ